MSRTLSNKIRECTRFSYLLRTGPSGERIFRNRPERSWGPTNPPSKMGTMSLSRE